MLYPQMNKNRSLYSLDGIWEFYKDCTDIEFKNVNLADLSKIKDKRAIAVPASWNDQYDDLFQFHGKGWYEKKFYVPNVDTQKDVYIRFGSVSGKAKVWVNGSYVMEHIGTALPFEAKITDYIKTDEENIVTLLADNTLDPWALPPATLMENEGRMGFSSSYPAVTYDFFPFGGIQRSVYVYTVSKLRIDDITITTSVNGDDASVKYKIDFNAPYTGDINISVDNLTTVVKSSGENFVVGELEIENVLLWDIGEPNLYEFKVELMSDNNRDSYVQTFGVREVEIKDNKLFLNKREIFLKGFGKHEDFHIIGKGFNHAVTVKDFALLKWIGANSFRTSHYPYDENILDMADREGILVIAETPFVGLNSRNYTEEILNKAVSVINEMINRDKNHPSVIMWSLANEPVVETDEGEHFFKVMAETARSLDATRPITYVAFFEPEHNRGMKYYDIICINKYYGWYEYPGQIDDSLSEFIKCTDRFYNTFKKGIILTEFGADAIAGIHTNPPQMFSEEYQSDMIEKQYELFRKQPYAVGTHVWAFSDFKTAQTISRIVFNRKGVFTREREPKMSAHTLRRLWNGGNNE